MPLTNLLNLCQNYDTKIKTKESIIAELVKFFKCDTLLFRAFDSEALAEIEEEQWGPATERLCSVLGIEVNKSNSFMPPEVNDEAVTKVENYLQTFDMWALLAMEQLTGSLKSSILPLLLSMREISAKEAVDLSLVELDFQTKRWGKVEWHHDVERQDLYGKVAAATLIIHHCKSENEEYVLSGFDRLKLVADELS